MAGVNGQTVLITRDSVAVGSQTGGSFTINNNLVDTSDKDLDFRTLVGGKHSLDITMDVNIVDDVAQASIKQDSITRTAVAYAFDDGHETIAGDFFVSSYAETANDDEVITASVTLQSTGAFTITTNV